MLLACILLLWPAHLEASLQPKEPSSDGNGSSARESDKLWILACHGLVKPVIACMVLQKQSYQVYSACSRNLCMARQLGWFQMTPQFPFLVSLLLCAH